MIHEECTCTHGKRVNTKGRTHGGVCTIRVYKYILKKIPISEREDTNIEKRYIYIKGGIHRREFIHGEEVLYMESKLTRTEYIRRELHPKRGKLKRELHT